MTDLIERLRIYAGKNYDDSVSFDVYALCADAADEIERLRKIEEERWAVVATRNAVVMRAEKAEALLNKRTRELDELRAMIDNAPSGECVSFDASGAWIIAKDDPMTIYPPLRGKRVALVALEDGK